MNARAIQLMEKGTVKKQRVVIKRTVVNRNTGQGKRFGVCTLQRVFCCAILSAICIASFLLIAALSYRDPKVSYNDFQLTTFDPSTSVLKLGWNCHLAIDNSANGFHMTTKPAKIFLNYGEDTNLDVVDLNPIELKAGRTVIETISHTTELSILDIPTFFKIAADWIARKDLEFHLKADLDVKVLFVEKLAKIDCSVVVKGRSLNLKQKMKCDVQYF
jgi:hypothetical protein